MSCLLTLPHCLLYSVNIWAWVVLGFLVVAAVTFTIYRIWGVGYLWTGVLILGAVLLALFGIRQRQQGFNDRKDEEKQADNQVRDEFNKIHKQDESLSDDELDQKNQPWIKP